MDMKDLAPVLVMAIIFVPIVIRMMLSHQRQMAEMMYKVNQAPQNQAEQQQVQSDIRDLKQLVQQQAIAIDNLSTKLDRMGQPQVADRLRETAQ